MIVIGPEDGLAEQSMEGNHVHHIKRQLSGVADAFGEEALAEEFEATNDQMTETFEITDACLFPDRADDE